MFGAALMVLLGVIGPEGPIASIDVDLIILLFGMSS